MSSRASVAIALAVVLSACATPPPEPPPREATMAPPTPVLSSPARPILRAAWRFEQDATACIATAAAGRNALRITVRHRVPVQLSLSLADAAPLSARLRFAGTAGGWQVQAQRAATHLLAATLGSDDTALGRVLILLSGGTLEIGEAGQGLPAISLPPSGGEGQTWFDCGRDRLS